MRKIIWLQTPRALWRGGENISPRYWNYMGLVMLVRQKNTMPEPSVLEIELAIEKLKSHKSPSIDQIPAELIKTGGNTIRCAIHKLIIAIWNKEELPGEWKESIIVPIHKKGDKTDGNNYRAYHFCQLRTKFCPTSCCQG